MTALKTSRYGFTALDAGKIHMISEDSFFELFCKEVQSIAADRGLSESESSLIIETVRQALTNPFTDERHIVARISGQGQADG